MTQAPPRHPGVIRNAELGRVLVVDDSAVVRASVAARLRAVGYGVSEAADGASALALLERDPHFDIILTDLKMPSLDGFGLLDAVRTRGLDPDVIVLTGSFADDPQAAVRAFRLGARDFLTKNAPQEALTAVEQAIERRRHRAALREAEDRLAMKTAQLEAVADAMMGFVGDGDLAEAASRLLLAALELTGSQGGIIGVIVDSSELHVLARRLPGEAEGAGCSVPSGDAWSLDNAFGRCLLSGRTIVSNGSCPDPCLEVPVRHGSPPHTLLAIPALAGKEVVGVVAVTDRDGGFGEKEESCLQVLTRACSVLFDSYRRRRREMELERQLRQAQKMEAVGRLAGGIAHDFNNVLTVVSGSAALLLRGLDPADPRCRRVEGILNATDRAASLTRQLLAFSRNQVFDRRVIDVNAFLGGIDDMLRHLVGEDVELRLDLGAGVWPLKMDQSHLEQVIINLVVNARDAMPRGGRLVLRTANVELDEAFASSHLGSVPGPHVLISVADTGQGMDEETRTHIFEPFYTTKPQGKGTGLGLAIVYEIVKHEGGCIEVVSAPGAGTRFDLLMPRGLGAAAAPAQPPQRECTPGNESVLVVEDDELLRAIVAETLTVAGYSVTAASCGEEALSVADARCVDLLLTDVVMPGINGYELAQTLTRRCPGIKTLYMSGYSDLSVLGEIAATAATVLQKPFSAERLAAAVRRTLDPA